MSLYRVYDSNEIAALSGYSGTMNHDSITRLIVKLFDKSLLFNFKIMLGSQETEIVARIKNMTDLSRVCRRCLVRIALRLILILYLDKS